MERARLMQLSPGAGEPEAQLEAALVGANDLTERPTRMVFNLALTVALIAGLVAGVLPLPVLFMLASAAALLVNYPSPEAQKVRIAAHAANIFPVISVIFAAGIFTGILNGTGMTQAMATSVAGAIPAALGPHLAGVTALISMPFTFLISNDAFMFGILPILAETGAQHGIAPAEMARAALTSQAVHLLSPLVPSTYLLVGLSGVELGRHQRFTIGWAALLSLVLVAAAMAAGVIPL
jgi:CitMHS family citrate-Mg2+:H+ or citrate-Ca2+:H+ symporter